MGLLGLGRSGAQRRLLARLGRNGGRDQGVGTPQPAPAPEAAPVLPCGGLSTDSSPHGCYMAQFAHSVNMAIG